ncbi:LysE family translocator [Gordonia soli]|uniref:Putative amino acid efflux protein n=1 Tax=Gordonia soli NBRC 108243 TaxID=1223545 RepID=M0QNK0_9ACTN|nr:LysE family translocator [Gordonia soli]GAC70240.1 putative amino acid efflux protein [Gordonia soli NBRC 108243]
MISWATFIPAAIVISIVPGPNQLVSLRNAIRLGVVPAVIGVVGRFAVFALMALAVAAGLGAVLSRSAVVFEVIRWAGVAYLVVVGFRLLWQAWHDHADRLDADGDDVSSGSPVAQALRHEIVAAVTNPKAMLLFAAFLPQFLSSSAPGSDLLVLAAAYIGIESVSALGYTVLGAAVGRADLTARLHRAIDAGSGAAFLGLGGWLAVSHRP